MALEHLTLRKDLQFLTLLPWAAVLTQQRLLRLTRAWCPDCFAEWQTERRPIYEPLLWNVSAVSLCLRHQRVLLESCPYPDCRATLPVLASHFRPGYCSKCSRWLGIATDLTRFPGQPNNGNGMFGRQKQLGNWSAHNMDLMAAPHLRNISDLIVASRRASCIWSYTEPGRKTPTFAPHFECLAIRQANTAIGILDALVLLLWGFSL